MSKVYVRSFGCSTNIADGEVIAGCLRSEGYEIVRDPSAANVLIYNTCAVKTPTENKIITLLKNAPKDKKLIVAGCLPLINFERLRREVRFDGVIGPAPGSEIVNVVKNVKDGRRVLVLRSDFKPSPSLPRVRSRGVIEIIPIAYGCVSACSYCCTRFARGSLRSYNEEEIVTQVRRALAEGISEIWLTAQDSACYGVDIGADLAMLLKRVGEIPGEFFVRVGMMNPAYVSDLLPNLIEAYKSERIFKFLHLPVQSGSDEVLKLMNRSYSTRDFKRIVETFRKEMPQLTLATDVICGFPEESREAFESSLGLIEEVKPDVVNISRFFPRPNTPAAKMKQLPAREVKERSRRIVELARRVSFERNMLWIGWEGEVLVDEKGKQGSWIGRNFAYKPIVIRSERDLLGKRLQVCIKNAFPTYLEAEEV